MKNLFFLLLITIPLYTYPQANLKIKPQKQNAFTWGYQDLLGEWIISPQFSQAENFTKDDIAIVGIINVGIKQHSIIGSILSSNNINKALYPEEYGFIDLNGQILIKYRRGASQKQIENKYNKAVKIVLKKKQAGAYNNIYSRLAIADSIIDIQIQKQKKQRDSIIKAQHLLKKRIDSITTAKRILRERDSLAKVKRITDSLNLIRIQKKEEDSLAFIRHIADSLWLVKTHKIHANVSGRGLSLHKIKISGDGLLLRKNDVNQIYSISRDAFNHYYISYDGEIKMQGILDVKKVIYESDWSLLSDELFNNVEIAKVSVEITRGAITKKFGAFSFLVKLNIEDLNITSKDEEANSMVLNAISQLEAYISSFIKHYQSYAYYIEPLFGGRESIIVNIADKKGNGAPIEDAKRICIETKQKF